MAFWASPGVSYTTVPVPVGVPSGFILVSARMMLPAVRNRSFKSCHPTVNGSCEMKESRCQPPRLAAAAEAREKIETHTLDVEVTATSSAVSSKLTSEPTASTGKPTASSPGEGSRPLVDVAGASGDGGGPVPGLLLAVLAGWRSVSKLGWAGAEWLV